MVGAVFSTGLPPSISLHHSWVWRRGVHSGGATARTHALTVEELVQWSWPLRCSGALYVCGRDRLLHSVARKISISKDCHRVLDKIIFSLLKMLGFFSSGLKVGLHGFCMRSMAAVRYDIMNTPIYQKAEFIMWHCSVKIKILPCYPSDDLGRAPDNLKNISKIIKIIKWV